MWKWNETRAWKQADAAAVHIGQTDGSDRSGTSCPVLPDSSWMVSRWILLGCHSDRQPVKWLQISQFSSRRENWQAQNEHWRLKKFSCASLLQPSLVKIEQTLRKWHHQVQQVLSLHFQFLSAICQIKSRVYKYYRCLSNTVDLHSKTISRNTD